MVWLGKTFRGALLATLVGLIAVGSAQAATRYAAPGGTGADPCASPATPCSIYTAADGAAPGTTVTAGDEVVLAPGEYSDAAGDLGPTQTVQLAPNISVHGEGGAARPLIRLVEPSFGFGAFVVVEGDTLSHVEIDTSTARSNLSVFDGVLEDAIARSSSEQANTIACVQLAGTIRNSACLTSGSNAAAIGESNATVANSTARLRNVTAVSTGAGSSGLSYAIFNTGSVTVEAKAVIAKGAGTDIVANGAEFGGGSGHVAIQLDHSDYSTAKETHAAGGSASVTPPETNGNITGVPLLAADGYHELEGSPTIDTGAVDGFSGAADIDGQSRSIGEPDIGADEWLHPTVVDVSCVPAEVVVTDAVPGSGTDCRARVSDETSPGFIAPTGTVTFSSSSGGEFSPVSCALAPSASGAESNCQVHYTPKLGSAGKHTITAAYSGDGSHEASQGSTSLTVAEAPLVCAANGTARGRKAGCTPPKPKKLTVHLKKRPKYVSTNRLARFTFSANRKGARFVCKLDKHRYKACRSPYKHRVRPGAHVFKVRAVLGRQTSRPAAYHWLVLRR